MPLSFTADLQAELLTPDGRLPLALTRDLASNCGEVAELTIPDGTVNLSLVLSHEDMRGVVLVTDAPLQVTMGPAAQNQPLTLTAGGMVALLDSAGGAETTLSVTYTPGTGVAAHVVLLSYGERAVPPVLECQAVLDGLVLCWDMNETSGNRMDHIYDVPLYPVGSPIGSAGRVNTAVQFVSASQQYLYNPTAFEEEWIGTENRHFLHFSAFTILFWVYVDAYPPYVGGNRSWGSSAGLLTNALSTFINNIDFEILLQSTGGIFASFSGGLGGTIGGPETGPVAPIPLRTWTLMQFWREVFPTAPRMALHYQVDAGPIITDVRTDFNTTQLPLDFFCVGAVRGTGGAAFNLFDGKIDRVMMWKRALTEAERMSFWP